MSEFEEWLAFCEGEREMKTSNPCCECGKESDCYGQFDDGAWVCEICCKGIVFNPNKHCIACYEDIGSSCDCVHGCECCCVEHNGYDNDGNGKLCRTHYFLKQR